MDAIRRRPPPPGSEDRRCPLRRRIRVRILKAPTPTNPLVEFRGTSNVGVTKSKALKSNQSDAVASMPAAGTGERTISTRNEEPSGSDVSFWSSATTTDHRGHPPRGFRPGWVGGNSQASWRLLPGGSGTAQTVPDAVRPPQPATQLAGKTAVEHPLMGSINGVHRLRRSRPGPPKSECQRRFNS
jgi:hypothetical protein